MGRKTAARRRSVPLLDLRAQFASIREPVTEAIQRVVESQQFILGESVTELERQVAEYSGADHAIGCASGSDALLLTLMACDVGPGDEVLTAPYTFFATGGAIARLGARPVFVDVEEDTFNMNVDQATEVLRSRSKLKAVIPVHLFGACVDMDPLLAASASCGVPVIEDAAQSIGAEYKGRRAGSIGDMGCFSFFPSKNLGAFGDAGMCIARDEAAARRLRSIRVHGSLTKYYHDEVGVNSRLDTLQAAVLLVKLRYLDEWSATRQRNADLYRRFFAPLDLPVTLPKVKGYQTRHIYNQFVIRAKHRDRLQTHLRNAGVGTEVYYPVPLHLQACFRNLGYQRGAFPVSEQLATDSLALPIYPELNPDDIEYVVETIQQFYIDFPSIVG